MEPITCTHFGAPAIIERLPSGIVAISKPSGWAMDGDHSADHLTILNWLTLQEGADSELQPVHRLDRGTSGIVLCAADPALRAQLGEWFADHQISKEYLALVHGRCHRKGIVRRALFDRRRQRELPAVTRYRMLEWLGPFSLLAARPETGRRHQLRRHLQAVGHAIVGDARYGRVDTNRDAACPQRIWLHAQKLTLPDGTVLRADLPEELQLHLQALRARERASQR